MTKFTFVAFGGKPAFLKTRPGCFIRIRDIAAITVGVPNTQTGELMNSNTVYLHLVTGYGAAFDACESHEAAVGMAEDLMDALGKADAAAAEAYPAGEG